MDVLKIFRRKKGKKFEPILTPFPEPRIGFSPNSYYYEGMALLKEGKAHSSVESFEKALGLNHEYLEAWYGNAEALSAIGNYDKAIEALDKAIELATKRKKELLPELEKFKEALLKKKNF